MAGDRPQLRPERPAPAGGRLRGLVALAALVGLLILTRPYWLERAPAGILVEVVGEVPRPGWYPLADPTVAAAIAAAGGPARLGTAELVREGDRVTVSTDGVRVSPGGDPLLIGLPVELNSADAEALAAIPGVKADLAVRIVAERATNGPFGSPDALVRVPGFTPQRIAELRPFISVDGRRFDAPVPVDLNRASHAELVALRGIGEVTAGRIIVFRAEQGPFQSVDDLLKIPGLRAETVDGLRDQVTVEAP